MSQETRRHKRFVLEGLEIGGSMMFASEVKILNISLSGVSLMADRRLELGTDYTLKLLRGDQTVSVKGKVVWAAISGTRPTVTGESVPVYTAGLRFSALKEGLLADIVNFIERNKKEKEPRISGLRFHIVDPAMAILSFPESFMIKKIGLGGMLIESIHEIDIDSVYPMELVLPEGEAIRFSGRVASCIRVDDDMPSRFDVGIEFLEMPDQSRAMISNFVEFLEDGG